MALPLVLGAHPWFPNLNVALVRAIGPEDRPVAGIFECSGELWAFGCLEEFGGDVSVWFYAPADAERVGAVKTADGPAELSAAMHGVFAGHVQVAMAAEDRIYGAFVVDVAEDLYRSVAAAARRHAEQVMAAADVLSEAAVLLGRSDKASKIHVPTPRDTGNS
ncbi:hypothetical protein Aph01nite_69690 [Acrocarpospora phusangensis]|uniref:Uncharacterized protein n=1 Tax=Acrocarpospora phusangensis TaxID=1070424 RepID=A0A919QII7_9ACTN|nr:hypothetical protein [Acrocarpospora phusangensis]GIH28659.1 hypothetical protein Aph01nite_69690 [Acrocarpospora phusangensis]